MTKAQVTCTSVFSNDYKAYSNILPSVVKALSDGTILVAGKGLAGTSSNYDGFVARLNPDGTQLWSVFIGGSGDDDFDGITPLNDGTTILFGSTQSFGHPEGKGWVVHVDATGAVLSSFLLGSSTTANDRVKAVQQYTDGDIVGTFNVSDGSPSSDPIVFKMGLDGTLRWTSRFDNGNDDSFTGIAFSGDSLYAAGYYTIGGTKQAVITLVHATDGSHLSSTNISYGGVAYQEQISGLQIYGGMISYGLYFTGVSGSTFSNEIILVQTDLAGNLLHPATYASDGASDIGSGTILEPVRTQDSGFYVLHTDQSAYAGPGVIKINKYGVEEWGLAIAAYTTMGGIDQSVDGGCVTVGNLLSYVTDSYNMRLLKITASGEVGSCNMPIQAMATGAITYQQNPFTWASEPAVSNIVQTVSPNPPVAAPMTVVADEVIPNCTGSVCVDHTPIPDGCNKTYNIAYSTDRSSALYDVVPTIDGGRVAVGSLTMPTTYLSPSVDGLVIKYQPNGDVVWAKNYNFSAGYDLSFSRVIMLADGNMLAIGNDSYYIGYGGNADIVMMKFDLNGNVLWVKSLKEAGMSDIGATPDGGFILLSGSIVLRFDGNANIIWQKGVTHAWTISSYLSVFCSGNNVDIAFHSDNYDNQIGVDRLSLATGDEIWSRSYTTASTSCAVNRIISIHDSVYLFLYNYFQYTAAPVTNLVIKLDTLGNFYQAQTWGADALNVTVNPPTVTLTSDANFVLASQIVTGSSSSFLFTKLKPDGTVLWSNNFPFVPYLPYNIHTQGQGFILPAVQPIVHTGNAGFINGAMMKLDKDGQFEAAAAGCQATTRPFVVSDYTSVGPISNSLSSVLPYSMPVVDGSVYSQDVAISPTLFCYTPGSCTAVTMEQKGAACAVGDTLVYYLDNSSNCGAAATWNYDPTLFKPGTITGDSAQLIVLQGGSSTVTAQVEGYCSFTQQTKVANIVLSATTPILSPDTVICDNRSVTLAATPGFASYVWDNNSTGSSLTVTVPGKYYVIATDQCGGLHSDTVLVTAADSLFHLTPDTVSCNQDVVTLKASNGYADYQWSPSYDLQPQGSQALVTPDITTTYTVTAQRWPGCTVTRSTLVTALSSPNISLGNDTTICSGDSLLLDAGSAFDSYQWSTGAANQKIYASQSGSYSVAALYNNGCISRDTFQLDHYDVSKPSLGQDSVLCPGSDKTLNAGGGYITYLWSNGGTGPSIQINQAGIYWVTVTDDHGCQAADTITIKSIECRLGLFVPNAFTPNGDGHNDRFKPLYLGNATHFEFEIFTRWGQKVFDTQSPASEGWDGTINGTPSPAGTYVWYCRYQPEGQPAAMSKGTVILIR